MTSDPAQSYPAQSSGPARSTAGPAATAPSSVYVLAAEGSTGKSTVALGLIRLLGGRARRVGVFRPVSPGDGPDRLLEVLAEAATADLPAADCVGATTDDVAADVESALARVVDRYHRIAAECDVVVVLGSDYTGVANPAEFDVNLRIAVNIGVPVLLVVRGAERSAEQIATAARLALDEIRELHAHPAGVVANRCAPHELDAVRAAVERVTGERGWALPEEPVLVAPTMGQLAEAVGGSLYCGDDALLGREVTGIVVAGMTGDHLLDHLVDGGVVIVPADRTDAVLAALAAHRAEGFPTLAGMIWNGGQMPSERMARLITGMRSSLPVVTTELGTFDAATAASHVRGGVHTGSPRKVETALSLLEKHVDTADLLARLEVPIPDVVTPQIFEYRLLERARSDRRHIVLPEGADDRILHAAGRLLRREVAQLTVLGDVEAVRRRAGELGIDLTGATLVDPATSDDAERFAQEYQRLRAHKGVTAETAREKMLDVSYFGTMMVYLGLADGMVSGAAHTTAHTIRPALEFVRTAPGVRTVSSVFFMCLADRVLAMGDCAVVPDPTAEQLADIAVSSAETAARFGVDPRVAMLSYSTGTSGSGADVDKVRRATELVHERLDGVAGAPPVEGPVQFDAAVDPGVAAAKLPDSPVAGRATVLVFPDLNTGNNTYKAVQRTAGAVAVGPVLQGLAKPINDLSRGATVADIVNTVAITAVQAQEGGAQQ